MSTDTNTSNDNIDAIFDLATDATPSTNTPDATSTPDGAENGTETDADASSADKGGALYPNVVRTLTASEAGEGNPDGTLTISEFAAHLTVEAVRAGGGLDSVVDKANIYTATKAARHPLPVVLVFADDDDQSDPKTAKVYLPVVEATEAYKARPARGEGSAATSSKKDQDALLADAAKRSISLANVTKRYNRVAEQKAKAEKLLEKSHGWLAKYYVADAADFQTITDANGETRTETQAEANMRLMKAAIVERAAQLEEEEAAKAAAESSDIPDNK